MTDNMNNLPSKKRVVMPNDIEKKYLESERFREWFEDKNIIWCNKKTGEIPR